jgi:nitrous oxidase accessory protein
VFIEGSYRALIARNVIAESDIALVLYDSEGGHRFEGNQFLANLSPLMLVGRRTDARFDGNYWSENREPDLDGDGRSDRPFRLGSVFDHLRGNLMAADLMTPGFAAAALGMAERSFPVIEPIAVLDRSPLARPPALPEVPRPDRRRGRAAPVPLALSAAALACGALLFLRGQPARAPGGAA